MKIQQYAIPGYGGLGDFGANASWEAWCDENYATPGNNPKCKRCTPLPIGPCLYFAPWTVLGKKERGLPAQTDAEVAAQTPPPIPEVSEAGESWFEQNKTLVIGGVLGLGLLAFALKGRKSFGGFLGFGSRRKRRSRR